MKILRTIFWVLAAVGFAIFAYYNAERVELKLWQNLVLETSLPALLLLVFAAGLVPMWAVHRSVVWRLNRRIRALETSLKNMATTQRAEIGAVPVIPQAADNPVEKSGTDGGQPAGTPGPVEGGSGK